MDDVLETVDGSDLAFATFVGSADDGDLVILSDWDGADIVLLTELLAQRCAHDSTSNAGRCLKMSLARFSPRGVEGGVDLGHRGGWVMKLMSRWCWAMGWLSFWWRAENREVNLEGSLAFLIR